MDLENDELYSCATRPRLNQERGNDVCKINSWHFLIRGQRFFIHDDAAIQFQAMLVVELFFQRIYSGVQALYEVLEVDGSPELIL